VRTDREYRNLEAERDALAEALEEWGASAYRSQTDCSVAASTIQRLGDERDALRNELKTAREANEWLRKACDARGNERDALAARMQEMHLDSEDKLAKAAAVILQAGTALQEVQDLISESSGVYGLHLNGDCSPWNEIEQGGRFERLCTLPDALSAIEQYQQGE